MPVLTHDELQRRLFGPLKEGEEPLVITPLLDSKQIGDVSIDVRLGNEFIIIRHTNLPLIDPTSASTIRVEIGQYQEHIRVGFGERFVLQPRQLVLGSTLEYIALPPDLTAQVIGRSSWGRLGLIIATATSVAPGFKGVITLELINEGQVPLILYPGVVIAQLIFEEVTGRTFYKGRYNYPTGPQFSRIHDDKDIEFWKDNFTKR
jgi:dCTP deaminase